MAARSFPTGGTGARLTGWDKSTRDEIMRLEMVARICEKERDRAIERAIEHARRADARRDKRAARMAAGQRDLARAMDEGARRRRARADELRRTR